MPIKMLVVYILSHIVSIVLGFIVGAFASSFLRGAIYGAVAAIAYHVILAISSHSLFGGQPVSVLMATLGMTQGERVGYWVWLVAQSTVFGALAGAAAYGVKTDLKKRINEKKRNSGVD
jgi:hypothetical protein